MTATLAALALLSLAAEPAWLAEPPLTADAAALAREAAALTPPDGSGIDVLLEEAVVAFDAQGRATTTYRLVYRAVTREGAERWGEVARAWAPWYQARPEIRARVIGQDGAVHALDPATLVEAGLGDEAQGLYGDRRVLKGPLPAVDAGTIVEEVETVRDTAPLFEAGQVRRFFVGRDGPVRAVRLRLEAPRELPLTWALRGGLAGEPRQALEGGRRILTWQWGPLAARARPEPLAPPEAASVPHVAFATGRSWRAVAAAYSAVVERQLAGEALAEVAAEVVPRGADRVAAAQAALDWLRRRVRYTGLELGEGALVPARPAEVLRRRYGDCKDLSLLMAGVLRAAGFPATLALVRADGDAPAELPGLGEFDHAIVAVGGKVPLFVDPTDAFTPAGELPAPLQGRQALVAWPDQAGLVRLPERPADANRVEVTREIRLGESGWADASEAQVLTGWPATDQRAATLRLGPGDRAERDHELVTSHFVEATSGQVTFDGLERPGAPLRLALSAQGSHWGITRADDAEAVVGTGYLLQWLPAQVRPRPPGAQAGKDEQGGPGQDGGEDGSDEGDEGAGDEARAGPGADRPRRGELLLPFAYGGSMRYRVVPPPGFEPELPLPEPRRLTVGPVTATSRFSVGADGVVAAEHELQVARRRLTAAEVAALREALAPLITDGPRVRFVRTSTRLLEAGKGREALDELRRLVALHPAEARHWNHLAQALLRLGMGEAARSAARRAVALEPSSSWAHRVLATALEHDALGRWMVPGCDLAGAVAAQRRAVELDRDPAVRAHLGFLLEHGEGCERWGDGARLDEAAAAYRFIRVELKSKAYERDRLLVLLRAGRFADAAPVAADLQPADRRAAQLAIRAATEGVAPAVADALRIPSGDRGAALDQAAQHLVMARRYPEAAGLLDGAAGGTPQSAQLKARAAVLAKVVRSEALRPDPREPATLPLRLLRALAEGGDAWKQVPEVPEGARGDFAGDVGPGFRRGLRAASGLPDRVALDAALSLLEVRVEGDPAHALRLVASSPSVPAPLTFAVVKERGAWRLVTSDPATPGLGAAARRLAEAGDAAGARAALRLARQGAGEPAEGRPSGVLQALAPDGEPADLAGLRLAGAALEAFAQPDAVRPLLQQARQGAAPAARQALGWALAAGLVRQDRWAELLPIAEELATAAPASERAFSLRIGALLELGRRDEAAQAIARRRADAGGEELAARASLSLALRDGDVAAVLEGERALMASGKATAGDHNNLAWAMVFQAPVDGAALEQARRAVELTREREPAYLHTLATVHAVRGEAAEAMQVLRKAVERGSADNRPSPHDWLVLGLVAERYGLAEEAAAAFRRVTPPERPDGLSSHELAQRRLKALGSAP